MSIEEIEHRIIVARARLEGVRRQRQMDDESFSSFLLDVLDKQAYLRKELAARECSTTSYLSHFQNDNNNNDAPRGDPQIIHKQAILCCYLHNIEVNMLQRDDMMRQTRNYCDSIFRLMKEEATEAEISLLNEICRVSREIQGIAEISSSSSSSTTLHHHHDTIHHHDENENAMSEHSCSDEKSIDGRSHRSIFSEFNEALGTCASRPTFFF